LINYYKPSFALHANNLLLFASRQMLQTVTCFYQHF